MKDRELMVGDWFQSYSIDDNDEIIMGNKLQFDFTVIQMIVNQSQEQFQTIG